MLSQGEAAEGVSERTFRRWRYEAEGAEGLYDRRLGRVSARRADADEVAQVLELFDTRYRDFNARHFHEKLVACHGVQRSYNWVRLTLQAHGRVRAAPRRPPAQAPAAGAARRSTRTARATSGCRVGSGRHHGRRHQRGLLGLLRRRGRHPFQALREVVGERGLFCSLYTGSHYFHTPEAGGKVDKDNPTQVGRALRRRRAHRRLLARGPRALGAGVRHPAETPVPRTQARRRRRHGRGQPLPQAGLPAGPQPALRHPAREGRPSCPSPAPWTTSSASTRTVSNDTRYKGRTLQIPADRHHYVKAKVRVHEYPDHTLAVFHGPGRLALYRADGAPTATRKAA